jgi:hypothetical protein
MAALEEMALTLPLAAANAAYPPLPSFGHQFARMQIAMLMQGQLLQMLAAWLVIQRLESGGSCGCQDRGRLSDGRGWGRWRSADRGWCGAPSGSSRRSAERTSEPRNPVEPRRSEPREPGPSIPCPPIDPGRYDGRTPAPECTSTRASANVDPPLTNSAAAGRDPNTYAQVINQFGVGENPRYARRNGNTYCNIFAWDVTRAMGAELPHWRRHDGTPAQPFERGAYEMNANGTARWLEQHGDRYGWRRVSAEEAQSHANRGAPAVAIRENPGGIGHVAVVRPGEMTDRGPCIAQAGGRNFNEGHARDVWRGSEPMYWVHD